MQNFSVDNEKEEFETSSIKQSIQSEDDLNWPSEYKIAFVSIM